MSVIAENDNFMDFHTALLVTDYRICLILNERNERLWIHNKLLFRFTILLYSCHVLRVYLLTKEYNQ